MADEGQPEQVILKLAANAQDAMSRQGTLTIETGSMGVSPASTEDRRGLRPGPYVQLSVSDTRTGMEPQMPSMIFEPFFTTKSGGRGTGLGLPTVYGIVKQHGGSIEASSTPGSGTTFHILFPATDARPPEKTSRSAAVDGGTETVLLLEDQDQLRELVSCLLRARGYTVLAARDGATALDLSARHEGPIPLLITEIVLEGMNGRDVHERISRAGPSARAGGGRRPWPPMTTKLPGTSAPCLTDTPSWLWRVWPRQGCSSGQGFGPQLRSLRRQPWLIRIFIFSTEFVMVVTSNSEGYDVH